MPTGKYTLAIDYTIQHIDHRIPAFHRDLLTAWHTHANQHARTKLPIFILRTCGRFLQMAALKGRNCYEKPRQKHRNDE